MPNVFYLVSAEGAVFQPILGTALRELAINWKDAGAPKRMAVVTRLSPPLMLRVSLFRRQIIHYAIICSYLEDQVKFPIAQWPYPAVLHRYIGDEQELLSIPFLGHDKYTTIDKIMLCDTSEEAFEIFNELR